MPLGGILFLTVFIALFGAALLYLASRISIRAPYRDPIKESVYECGMPVVHKKDTKISVKFYLTAILFIIFDIEIIFLYPWAITYKDFIAVGLGPYILVSMMIFLAIFLYGLVWEIKSRALEWE